MNALRKLVALILVVWTPAYALSQNTNLKGSVRVKGSITLGAPLVIGAGNVFAQLPSSWVNSGLTTGTGFCSPPGGIYDATKTIPGDYPATFAGLAQAKTDQVAANQWWLLKVTAGTNIHGSSYDGNNALLSWPSGGAVTKCLVVQSSTHNTDSQIVCAHGLPGFGAVARSTSTNCSNDGSKFWKFTIDSGGTGVYGMFCPGPVGATPACSYLLVEDAEISPAAGSAQSKAGVNVILQANFEGDHVGFAYNWVHGWNPGDSGQPGIGSGNAAVDNATGVCLAWNKSGTVNTSGTTATWVSGDQFGMDFADATHSSGWPQAIAGQANQLVINGTGYTISSHDPGSTATTLTLGASAGTQTGVAFTLQNPATVYATGCGDDSRGIQMNCTNCFEGFNQFNKIHWWGSESHAVSGGFSAGPVKHFYDWIEAGSGGMFFGGAPVDTRGGPGQDIEAGNIFIGRDLNWRLLSAASGNSPAPPFGCGPIDGISAHDTCSFHWGIKNNLEIKECNRCVFYAIILDGSWADGQSGYLMLLTPRSASGGQTAGIYDPATGLPWTVLQNIRVQDFWFRNCPQGIQISSRSLAPGDGGGISAPVQGLDFINGVVSNCGDRNQWGQPGAELFTWNASGQTFLGTLSRTGGVAHAVIAPMKIANYDPGTSNVGTFKTAMDVSSVASVADVVTIKLSNDRHDPTVGGQAVIATASGWNGTFTISSVKQGSTSTACSQDNFGNNVSASLATQPQPCIRADGTFGDTIVYTDSINHPGTATLCATLAACNALNAGAGIQVTIDTLSYKVSDISIGDGVFVHNCTGGSLGNPTLFQVGATSRTAAVSPTNPAGLDIYYANAGADDSGVSCQVENSSGWPARTSFQNVTVLSPTFLTIGSNGVDSQHYQNWFLHNVFGVTDASNTANVTCTGVGTEGTNSFACWDAATFQFFDNVLQGRNSANWSVVPIGSPVNFTSPTPSTVTCSGATATTACMGYTGFMSGTAFPTTAVTYDGSNPLNAPLMTAPWSSNFGLPSIVPVASSSYKNEGVNTTTLNNAFTATGYVCPVGANCGGTGPFPD